MLKAFGMMTPKDKKTLPTFSKVYDSHKKDLRGKKAVLLGEIEALSRKTGYCYAKGNYMAKKLGICKKTLMNYYKSLEQDELIIRQKVGRRTHIILGEKFYNSSLKDTISYTYKEVKNTPINNLCNPLEKEDKKDFCVKEKIKRERQTKEKNLFFNKEPFSFSKIQHLFLNFLKEEDYHLSKKEEDEELIRFYDYHKTRQNSYFSLKENLKSWITRDKRGLYKKKKKREIEKKEKVLKEEKFYLLEKERRMTEREQKEDEKIFEKFFHLFRTQKETPSLLELWEKVEREHKIHKNP